VSDGLLCPGVTEWRAWLAGHAEAAGEVWLVVHRRGGGPSHAEAVEQALCFGWIDSLARRRDAGSFLQRFSPRRAGSRWSELNRDRVARLTEAGLMAAPGLAAVERARADGTWRLHPTEAELAELDARLDADPPARANFEGFPPSSRRLILTWIATAKRAQTRQQRIEQTVALAGRGIRAAHPRTPPYLNV
jgi:uncharacterized protein YdeI (YjbR/CyaY-like superfamily)